MKMNGFNVVVTKDYHTWTGARRDRSLWREGIRLGWVSGMSVGFVFGIMAACFVLGVLPGIWRELL